MSRATRPLRRVGADAREALALRVFGQRAGEGLRVVFFVWPNDVAARWLVSIAYGLGCRPAHLRRCLLGRPVSARAAERILDR